MAESLDVYRDWLGITETARPLNHYQLFRLKTFEDDTSKIRAHYQKMNAHVRKFVAGPHAEPAQQLLNELARAMLCLTDAQRKREYDATLGRKGEVAGRRLTLEEILLANKVIDQAQLDKARRYADQVGVEIRDAILQQKLAPPDVVMLAYAEAQGLPYVELEDVGVDEQLVPQIPAVTARQNSCVPIMADAGRVLMASPNPLIPDVEDDLRLRLGMPVRTVLCAPVSVNRAITKYYASDAAPAAAAPAPARRPAVQEASVEPQAEPLSREEQQKRQIMYGVVAFNVTVILAILLRGQTGFFLSLLIALTLGLIVGGLTFLVAGKLKF